MNYGRRALRQSANATPPATTKATALTHIGMNLSATVTWTPQIKRRRCARDTTASRTEAVRFAGLIVTSRPPYTQSGQRRSALRLTSEYGRSALFA